jgi:hypothetical protein
MVRVSFGVIRDNSGEVDLYSYEFSVPSLSGL